MHEGWGLNTYRGHGGPSLILAVDTQLALFGRPPGCPQGLPAVPPIFFFFFFLFLIFFLTLLINTTLPALKTVCPCAGAVVLLSLRRASGVWAPVCCTGRGPQPPAWGCYTGLSVTYKVIPVSSLFSFLVLVLIPPAWPEAELNFCSAARHD